MSSDICFSGAGLQFTLSSVANIRFSCFSETLRIDNSHKVEINRKVKNAPLFASQQSDMLHLNVFISSLSPWMLSLATHHVYSTVGFDKFLTLKWVC